MDRALVLERLGLASQDWGAAVSAATYAEFAAGWRGTVPVPTEAEMDAEWAAIQAGGGVAAITAAQITALAKDRFDDAQIDGRLLRAVVAGIIDSILPAINQLRQNPSQTFPAISRATAIDAVRANTRAALDAQ